MLLATRSALVSPHVEAVAIEATAFAVRADRAGVLRVPAVVVNDSLAWSGALPEHEFVTRLVTAAG